MTELVDREAWVSEDMQILEGRPSFEEFYRNEYRRVWAFAYVLAGSRSLADDITQEAFMAAYRGWDRIENPEAWARTTVSNMTHSWQRRRYAEVRALTRIGRGRRATFDEVPAETAHFWAEVRRLPKRQAQVLALLYLEDRSAADTAEILGCSEATVRQHLMRGRATLARRLDRGDAP